MRRRKSARGNENKMRHHNPKWRKYNKFNKTHSWAWLSLVEIDGTLSNIPGSLLLVVHSVELQKRGGLALVLQSALETSEHSLDVQTEIKIRDTSNSITMEVNLTMTKIVAGNIAIWWSEQLLRRQIFEINIKILIHTVREAYESYPSSFSSPSLRPFLPEIVTYNHTAYQHKNMQDILIQKRKLLRFSV